MTVCNFMLFSVQIMYVSVYQSFTDIHCISSTESIIKQNECSLSTLLSGVPDYFDRNKISSGGDLSHYSSASLY